MFHASMFYLRLKYFQLVKQIMGIEYFFMGWKYFCDQFVICHVMYFLKMATKNLILHLVFVV